MAITDAQTGGRVAEGHCPVKITLAGTVATGDLIGYSSGWKRALATVGSVVQAELVAGQDGVTGDEITAFALAVVDGRISGATPGAAIYAAEGTAAGKVTETAPTTQGDANKRVGVALSATAVLLIPAANPSSLAP
jgi:hypothetical protein